MFPFVSVGNPRLTEYIKPEVFANYNFLYGKDNWRMNYDKLEVRRSTNFEPRMSTLYFVTTNSAKVRSARRSLGDNINVERVSLDVMEEQATVRAIATHKARIAYAVLCKPVITDDSGFHIPSQDNWPGTRVGRVLQDPKYGIDHFMRLAEEAGGKLSSYWEMTIAYFDSRLREPKLFTSRLDGHIIPEQRGRDGQLSKSEIANIFVPNPSKQSKTIAEMTRDEYVRFAKTTRWDRLKNFLQKRTAFNINRTR